MAKTKKATKTKKAEEPKIEEKNGQKPIIIKETEEDVVLGTGFSGDPDDFKNEVKKEAEKGAAFKRIFLPLLVFLLIGGLVGFATWYYARPEKSTPRAEEKIQTPPTVDDTKKNETPAAPAAPAPTPAPAPASTAKTYTVQSGDTMSSIANANGMTSAQLSAYNGITDPNSLQIGQVLKIPAQ
jgi:LysM repeat protein